MFPTRAYAAQNSHSSLVPFSFERRALGKHDVLIKILYCGICHSDIHQARNEWGGATYPMVPGHEIVGRVIEVGSAVKKFKLNDPVGVGCFVDSCRTCSSCEGHEEQFCEKHTSFTYNSTESDLKTPTQGGYSSQIVVDENYVLRLASEANLEKIAPLLCAGITTYAPLRRYKIGAGQKVGVVGLGGLGHMAVKLATSMGAEVTVFSTSPNKEKDARRLGAHHFVVTKDHKKLAPLARHFDFILNTISAPYDPQLYLDLLKRGGVMALVGVPEKPLTFHPKDLILPQVQLSGSLIGGIKETQEMLDYCAKHNITADVEVIPAKDINTAFERTLKSDVKYRFVIDMSTLG